jgi:hypothetical protein
MNTNKPVTIPYDSPWERFPFTKHNSHKELITGNRVKNDENVGRTSCTNNIPEDSTSVGDRAEASSRSTMEGSWVHVSSPILTGSWMEVVHPNLEEVWIDGSASRAPSCSDDDTRLPDPKAVKDKANFVWGWLKAMGGAIQR